MPEPTRLSFHAKAHDASHGPVSDTRFQPVLTAAENVAILLTPPGSAAIAVIRLRGPAVRAFLLAHFSKSPTLNRCIHGNIIDTDRIIDDAVVVLCDDDTVDLNVHGGNWVVRSVLDLAAREGFKPADSSQLPLAPHSLDAPMLLQQEILSHLPMARTELGIRTLLAQQAAWEQLQAASLSDPDQARQALRQALDDPTLDHLLNPPTVAIVGPPNVGKSTLANQLFAQQRSITADLPGTTRDWVGEIANLDGFPVLLLDTPGLRHTVDPIEAAAIDLSLPQITRAQLVVLVLDITTPLAGDPSQLLTAYPDALLVLNKCDRPSAADLDNLPALRTTATSGHGIPELRRAIAKSFCRQFPPPADQPRCWTPRQRQIAARAISDLAILDELFTQSS